MNPSTKKQHQEDDDLLDNKKLGSTMAAFRKGMGHSQERLAELLCVTPQAISKWENGHSIPETSLLPVLAGLFGCTIDDIIMPAYAQNQNLRDEKPSAITLQADYIAGQILQKMEEKAMKETILGLHDESIIRAVTLMNPNLGDPKIIRGKPFKTQRFTGISITVNTEQQQLRLIERIYTEPNREIRSFRLFGNNTTVIPLIYHINDDETIILMEDCNDGYVQGCHFNDEDEKGQFVKDNHHAILQAAAKLHGAFWENNDAFGQIGLDWRWESKENLLAHISGMEKEFHKYRKNEESGKIPKVWNIFENHLDHYKLEYFSKAIEQMKEQYTQLPETRYNKGKNITIIHGDLHPGNTFIPKASQKTVKFIDLKAVRMGLPTEDLAMLLALHIEPSRREVMPLLVQYHQYLSEFTRDYTFEMLLNDYKISLMEALFFPLRLIARGIYDFSMRDRAMRAYETFVLDIE